MRIMEMEIKGVMLFEPIAYTDVRGYFVEAWNRNHYAQAGLDVDFVQDNVSYSKRGVLRGLHFQNPNQQGKLVQVLQGKVWDVGVDVRTGSPTFGQSVSAILSEENHHQLYLPAGFAHGFCVLSEYALFSYKCTDYYNAQADIGILWNDPDLNIDWPVTEPILSEKDVLLPRLSEIPKDSLPIYEG